MMYKLPRVSHLVAHLKQRVSLVRDGQEPYCELDALVTSGDYFVTIATQLDTLTRMTRDYQTKQALENLISDLIYLQDHYVIAKQKTEQQYGPAERTEQAIQG